MSRAKSGGEKTEAWAPLPHPLLIYPASGEDPLRNLGTPEFVSRELVLVLNPRIGSSC